MMILFFSLNINRHFMNMIESLLIIFRIHLDFMILKIIKSLIIKKQILELILNRIIIKIKR